MIIKLIAEKDIASRYKIFLKILFSFIALYEVKYGNTWWFMQLHDRKLKLN